MDFGFSDEQKLLRQTVRRFVQDNLIPLEEEYRGVAAVRAPESIEVSRGLQDKAKALGLWNLGVPREFGGQGMSCIDQTIVSEEISRYMGPAGIEPGIRLTI